MLLRYYDVFLWRFYDVFFMTLMTFFYSRRRIWLWVNLMTLAQVCSIRAINMLYEHCMKFALSFGSRIRGIHFPWTFYVWNAHQNVRSWPEDVFSVVLQYLWLLGEFFTFYLKISSIFWHFYNCFLLEIGHVKNLEIFTLMK